MARTVVAITTFAATDDDGQQVLVVAGERFDAGHPLVKAHGANFADEQHDVHQAPKRRGRKA